MSNDFRAEALAGFYRQIANESGSKRVKLYRAMLKMIENGFWNPGDRLPTDVEFTELLPLSLATVQAALKMLAEQEIIVRKKRNGTFVATEEHLSRDVVFFRFVEAGSTTYVGVEDLELSVFESTSQGAWTDFLGERDRYIVLTRTIGVGGKFRVRSEFHFANPKLRLLLDIPVDALKGIAVRSLLQFRFGLPTTALQWQSSFETFDEGLARTMGVPEGVVGQRYDVTLRTLNDNPLAYHRFWVPPNELTMLISP